MTKSSADEIRRLSAERDAARAECDAAVKELDVAIAERDAALAEIETLREALEPFGKAAVAIDKESGAPDYAIYTICGPEIYRFEEEPELLDDNVTLGDLRRARAALERWARP